MKIGEILIGVLVFYGAFTVGVWGFAQIIGSLQNIKVRPPILTASTIVLWTAIIVGVAFGVLALIPKYKIPLAVGYIISFIKILLSGKIK